MMDLVGIFTNPGELVFDFFTGTLDVSKAYIFIQKNSHLVGCDRDDAFLDGFKEIIVKVYTSQLLSPESYFTGSKVPLPDKKWIVY